MVNISKQFDEVVLPNGTIATSFRDVEKYLNANDLAFKEDYSDEFYKTVRHNNEKAQRREAFADFIHNYKRKVWNE